MPGAIIPALAAATRAHLTALRLPFTEEEIAALADRTEMEALVAYTQWLGHAVPRGRTAQVDLSAVNPLAGSPQAVARGAQLFAENCAACHGDDARGLPDVAPSLIDDAFLEVAGDLPDAAYFAMIRGGSDAKAALGRPGLKDGGMTAFEGQIADADIWSIVAYLRDRKGHSPPDDPPPGGGRTGAPGSSEEARP